MASQHQHPLVGGIPNPLKNMKVSWDAQYMQKKSSKPTSTSRFKLIVASLFTQLVSGFYDHMSHEILDPIPSYHIVLLITS